MYSKFLIILFLLCCVLGCNTQSSDFYDSSSSDTLAISPEDSISASALALNLYTWYASEMKKDTMRAFDPAFAKDADGFTTLDFSVFENNMRRLRFTSAFIKQVKDHYSVCIENLRTVPYDTILAIKDPERMKTMRCYFQGDNIWAIGSTLIHGAEILDMARADASHINVLICTYEDFSTRVYDDDLWVVNTVKNGNEWNIQNIDYYSLDEYPHFSNTVTPDRR